VDGVHNPDAAVALSRAVNDWQIEEWLNKDPRLRAAIVVPIQLPELAAQEIDRVGAHPGFIQVLLPVRSAAPYGNRRFHVVYEAALRQDLVIGIHSGGAPGNAPSSVGWFSTYAEDYTNMASVFQSQLLSLICEGVFDRFPNIRLTLQPFDGPMDSQATLEIIDQMGTEDLLMFSTDYPHWHFDSPDQALPEGLPSSLVQKIQTENARAFYRF
jgi:predicted TIM-barrel fold metal-dependent hydrolase